MVTNPYASPKQRVRVRAYLALFRRRGWGQRLYRVVVGGLAGATLGSLLTLVLILCMYGALLSANDPTKSEIIDTATFVIGGAAVVGALVAGAADLMRSRRLRGQ